MYKFTLQNTYNFLLIVLAASFSLPDRVAPPILIVLALASVALRFKLKIPFSLNRVSILFIVIFLYYLFRLWGSNDLSDGIKFLEKNLSFIIVPLIFIPNLIHNKKSIIKVFILGFSSVAIYTIIFSTISHYFLNSDTKWYFQNIEQYGFHPTYMGMYSIISLIFLEREKLFKNKNFTILLIAINIAFIIFSASRISIITLIFIFILRAIFERKKHYLIILVGAFSSLLLFYFASSDFKYKVNQLTSFRGFNHYDNNDYGSVSVRVAKIKTAKKVWLDNKWLGVGTGGLSDELVKTYRSKDIECWPCAQRRYNPHNQYLSILSGHGLIGFFIFALLIISILFRALKDRNYILLEIVLVFLTIGFTESILERQKGLMLFTFFLYFCYSKIETQLLKE